MSARSWPSNTRGRDLSFEVDHSMLSKKRSSNFLFRNPRPKEDRRSTDVRSFCSTFHIHLSLSFSEPFNRCSIGSTGQSISEHCHR